MINFARIKKIVIVGLGLFLLLGFELVLGLWSLLPDRLQFEVKLAFRNSKERMDQWT